jgi:hypothetical protein
MIFKKQIERAEAGDIVLLQDVELKDVFILWSGTVSVCNAARFLSRKQSFEQPKNPSCYFQKISKAQLKLLDCQQTEKIIRQGTCLGAASVLLGGVSKDTFIAAGPCIFCRVPARAIGGMLKENYDVISRIAATMIEQRNAEQAVNSEISDAGQVKVSVHIIECHTIPDFVRLGNQDFDPTCVVQLGSQRAQTVSQR